MSENVENRGVPQDQDSSWEWLNPDSDQAEKLVIDTLRKTDVPADVGTITSLAEYFGTTLFNPEVAAGESLANSSPELAQIVSAQKSEYQLIGGRRTWLVQAEIEGIPAYMEFAEFDQTAMLFNSGIDKTN